MPQNAGSTTRVLTPERPRLWPPARRPTTLPRWSDESPTEVTATGSVSVSFSATGHGRSRTFHSSRLLRAAKRLAAEATPAIQSDPILGMNWLAVAVWRAPTSEHVKWARRPTTAPKRRDRGTPHRCPRIGTARMRDPCNHSVPGCASRRDRVASHSAVSALHRRSTRRRPGIRAQGQVPSGRQRCP